MAYKPHQPGVHVQKRGNMFRIVDNSTDDVTRLHTGTAVDSGGHKSEQKAWRQEVAINESMHKADRKKKRKKK